jgi:hypothetical protein
MLTTQRTPIRGISIFTQSSGRKLRYQLVTVPFLLMGFTCINPLNSLQAQVALSPPMFNLSQAIVIAPESLSTREKKAVILLVEEVGRRTGIRWAIGTSVPKDGVIIAIGQESALRTHEKLQPWLLRHPAPKGSEGYRIGADLSERTVLVVGNDTRGILFGVGRLLRELRMTQGQVLLPAGFFISSAPQYPLRGHQLGYRPKTNSYDAWDLNQWEQYYRDLAVFGTNAVELIPPRSDDDANSPHFPRPPMEMMVGMSQLADDYGLDVWIWYPAMDADYSDPKTTEFALREWGDVFQKLPRIDAVFVPGGDPGHTRPKVLLSLLEQQAASLRRHHPKAQMWVSPQSFNKEWLDEFLSILQLDQPQWLDGVVFGPQVRIRLAKLRTAVPPKYPIRNYPDITHSMNCQYPVPDWDLAFALTQGREVINPRPLGQAAIFRACRDHTIGFLTYSEGCNDDVNKFVWSGLGWNPETPVIEILRQYARYLIGDRYTDSFAQGLLALERNWQGPLLANSSVDITLQQFQDMEQSAAPHDLRNWRFQQALYRAYYDAYLRDRLIAETAAEIRALAVLRQARRLGSARAFEQAQDILSKPIAQPNSSDRRARVFELAEALFQSIRMQLSVPRYKAISVGRGATLDTIDVPLNNRLWLESQFLALRQVESEQERLHGMDALLNRTNPGPGGFYDNLGDIANRSHLVRRHDFAEDPDFRRSSVVGFDYHRGWPQAWCRNAQSLYDTPLMLYYRDLDPSVAYRVRVVYGGDNFKIRIQLDADGQRIHPLMLKPDPIQPLEFDIPAVVTADGELTLRWSPEPARGGNGRGCQISEVWLIRKQETTVP